MEQAFSQGYVLAALLFIIFFAAVINVAYTHLKVDRAIMSGGGRG